MNVNKKQKQWRFYNLSSSSNLIVDSTHFSTDWYWDTVMPWWLVINDESSRHDSGRLPRFSHDPYVKFLWCYMLDVLLIINQSCFYPWSVSWNRCLLVFVWFLFLHVCSNSSCAFRYPYSIILSPNLLTANIQIPVCSICDCIVESKKLIKVDDVQC